MVFLLQLIIWLTKLIWMNEKNQFAHNSSHCSTNVRTGEPNTQEKQNNAFYLACLPSDLSYPKKFFWWFKCSNKRTGFGEEKTESDLKLVDMRVTKKELIIYPCTVEFAVQAIHILIANTTMLETHNSWFEYQQ